MGKKKIDNPTLFCDNGLDSLMPKQGYKNCQMLSQFDFENRPTLDRTTKKYI